jgi:hypothetical protein
MEWRENARNEAAGTAGTALWTTLSGFESLPPSQLNCPPSIVYRYQFKRSPPVRAPRYRPESVPGDKYLTVNGLPADPCPPPAADEGQLRHR